MIIGNDIRARGSYMKTLDEIALASGTDKHSLSHNYTCYYEIFLEPIRNDHINLLEIGIDKGNSLRLWKEYFPNAEIHGIDIIDCSEHADDRIIIHVADQSKEDELFRFGQRFPQYFDIIIDDGSHQSGDMILSFEILFSYLKSGGIYVIEDLLCAYDSRWNQNGNIYDRIRQMVGEIQMNGAIPNDSLCANKLEAVKKYNGTYFEKNIEWIFVSCGLVIIKKI